MTVQHTILAHIAQEGDITHVEATELYGIDADRFIHEISELVFRRMVSTTYTTIKTKENNDKRIYKYAFTDEGRIAWESHPDSNFKPTPQNKLTT